MKAAFNENDRFCEVRTTCYSAFARPHTLSLLNNTTQVVQQEWEYMDSREAVLAAEVENGNARQNSAALLPQDPQFVPPGPPLLGEDGRRFDVGAYVRESTVFPFVLFESFWEYSNPKLDGGEGAGASRHGNYDAAGLVEEEQR